MRQRPRLRTLHRLALSIGLTIAAVFTLAPPAHAAVVTGPFRRYCTVDGRRVAFDFWLEYQSSNSFSVYRVKWNTGGFRPSRLVISLRQSADITPIVRAWGGSARTLRDVGATGDTGGNWGTTGYWVQAYQGIFARVYLNADKWCNTGLLES